MLAVITGASGSIGAMCAYEAARLKFDVLMCYNNTPADTDMLSGFGVKINSVRADITTTDGQRKIADTALKMGGADVLVNNAGTAQIKAFLDTDKNDTNSMINTNLVSHIDLTRLILPQMIKKQSGGIVNISSVWGVSGASCEVLYSSAKAGMIGFTKSLAKELALSGITVNCVAPGCIDSKMLDGLDKKSLCDMIPLGRTGNALEVAKAVFFLATHGYITGQVLNVDGGMII